MKNKNVGLLIVAISILVGFIIYLFNRALTSMINETCSHGASCPMWGTLRLQTNIGIAIMVFIVLVGLYLVFFAKDEVRAKPKKPKKKHFDLSKLTADEKKVFGFVVDADGTIFQSELVEKTKFTKVKVTRILDKLEGKNYIERKRRGMTNVVILKH